MNMIVKTKEIFNKENIKVIWAKRDKIASFTFFCLIIKYILFQGIVNSKNSSRFNLIGVYFTLGPIISHAMFFLIFISIGFLLKKNRGIYYIIFHMLITILLLLDLFYYRNYGTFLSFYFIKNKDIFNPLNRSLIQIRPIDILLVMDIPFIINKYNKKKGDNLYKRRNILAFLIILSLSVTKIGCDHYIIDVKDVSKGNIMFFRNSWYPFQTMSNLSPIGYHFFDGIRQFNDSRSIELSKEEKEDINDWYIEKEGLLNYKDENKRYQGRLKGKNLIFIQVESLENFVIGEKVQGQEITPNLNEMVKNSFYFNNIYEQTGSGTSADGDFISNTSILPLKSGVAYMDHAANKYNSMPYLMKGLGYNTISTHPEKGGNWNWIHNHKALGYDKIFDVNDYKLDDIIGSGLSDGSLFNQISDKVSKEDTPFFLHMATLTSHGPFDLPEDKKALNLPSELDRNVLGKFFQSINYVDREIGNFMNILKDKDMLKDTVVVIYGDHTGVHKFYEDKLKGLDVENEKWLEKEMKVPFIIYNQDIEGETFNNVGGQIDIMPTVAYLMGVPEEEFKHSAMGRVMFQDNWNFTVLFSGEVVGNPPSDKEKDIMLKGPYISNKIIKGNYFKK